MLLSEHMKILGADAAHHEHHLLYMPIFACTGQRLQLRLFQPMPRRTGGTMRTFRRSFRGFPYFFTATPVSTVIIR
jgi:hypothetical protein